MVSAIRLLPLFFAATMSVGAFAQRTPDEALAALQDGNKRFAADRSVPQPIGEGVRRTLARGQSPFAIVLCCADSRVPPEHVFNAGLGELFVVRVAGHTADPETVASIEYAVEHLGASLCVVLGHEKCGAIAATVQQVDENAHQGRHSPAISQLLEHIEPAVRKAKARDLGGKELHDACEEEHAHYTVHDCFRRSALLRRYASVGKFRMVAARYQLASGQVEWLPNRPLPTAPKPDDHAVHGAVPASVPPHVALRMLQAGHRRFLGDGKPTADLTAPRREILAQGQQPMAIVLACADSRVAPEHIFDAGLGELFVIRIAGNTVNDDALASIEYAAGHLGASLLIVMGHTKCGAVAAAAQHPEGQELSPNLRQLLLRIEPSVAAARAEAKGRDVVDLAVRANALRAVSEARSRSAALRELEHAGRFTMLGCVYDIASGDVEWLKDGGDHAPAVASAGSPADQAPHGDHGSHAAVAQSAKNNEPAKAHGDDAKHGDAHGHAAHGKEAHGHANHGHEPTPPAPAPATGHGELPALEWAHGAPAGETKAPTPGKSDADHGSHGDAPADHGHQKDGAHGHAHPHEAHASHDAHADKGHAEQGHAPKGHAAFPWQDPIVLVGITGVVSLLAAAVLAMKKR